MRATEFPCMWSTTLLTLCNSCQLLGWIYNLCECNFIYLCILHPLLYLFLPQLILSSMQLLFFLDLLLQHMQLLLCSILYLHGIFMSRHHLIASISKVSFTTSGFSWACNFVPDLCCQQPSSCLHCVQVCCLLLLLMVLLVVMLLPYYLDALVYEQLDVFIGRRAHINLFGCKPCWAINDVLWICSTKGHCTCDAETQKNTYDAWRHRNIDGKQSVSRKQKKKLRIHW